MAAIAALCSMGTAAVQEQVTQRALAVAGNGLCVERDRRFQRILGEAARVVLGLGVSRVLCIARILCIAGVLSVSRVLGASRIDGGRIVAVTAIGRTAVRRSAVAATESTQSHGTAHQQCLGQCRRARGDARGGAGRACGGSARASRRAGDTRSACGAHGCGRASTAGRTGCSTFTGRSGQQGGTTVVVVAAVRMLDGIALFVPFLIPARPVVLVLSVPARAACARKPLANGNGIVCSQQAAMDDRRHAGGRVTGQARLMLVRSPLDLGRFAGRHHAGETM